LMAMMTFSGRHEGPSRSKAVRRRVHPSRLFPGFLPETPAGLPDQNRRAEKMTPLQEYLRPFFRALENVPHGELQISGVSGLRDNAIVRVSNGYGGVLRPEAVGYVVCFDPKLQPLTFAH
jgi:hypothetical protein